MLAVRYDQNDRNARDVDDCTHLMGSSHNSFETLCGFVDTQVTMQLVDVSPSEIDCDGCKIAAHELLAEYTLKDLKAVAKGK